jgi:hypothetical protein
MFRPAKDGVKGHGDTEAAVLHFRGVSQDRRTDRQKDSLRMNFSRYGFTVRGFMTCMDLYVIRKYWQINGSSWMPVDYL